MDFNEGKILELLHVVLGDSKRIKNEHAFHCPFCHHHKPKLQIDIASEKWHCWVCDAKGRSVYSLFRRLNVGNEILSAVSKYSKAKQYHKEEETDEVTPLLLLPREFTSLKTPSTSIHYNSAVKYLKRRNITYEDIVKYNIGFCDGGIYSERIIVPSYDENGSLNYFIARSFYPAVKMKYKNPPVSKNVIIFDLHINWREPITLCEGVFDAIAIKQNAIPLLGKFISKKLHEKIILQGVKKLNILLDSDAREDATKIANRYLREGIDVSIIEVDKDPADAGFSSINKQIIEAESTKFKDLIRHKLNV